MNPEWRNWCEHHLDVPLRDSLKHLRNVWGKLSRLIVRFDRYIPLIIPSLGEAERSVTGALKCIAEFRQVIPTDQVEVGIQISTC